MMIKVNPIDRFPAAVDDGKVFQPLTKSMKILYFCSLHDFFGTVFSLKLCVFFVYFINSTLFLCVYFSFVCISFIYFFSSFIYLSWSLFDSLI